MIYKNIEIHNIGHIEEHEQGITWLRVPQSVYHTIESDMGRAMARNAIGVELRFVVNNGPVKITMRSLSDARFMTSLHTFYGGLQGGWDGHEMNAHIPTVPTEFVFHRPSNLATLQAMTKHAQLDWDPEVVRIILERGDIQIVNIEGDVMPPSKEQIPSRILLTYGSSITHGSNSLSISNAWTSLVAHHLGMDLRNLGMAGSCRMEPEMVDYIASMGEQNEWHMAILELGINVLEWKEDLIRERVSNTLQQIAGRNPTKPIVVISPFYSNNDFQGLHDAEKWRRLLPEIIAQHHYPNVHYINGLELLGDMSLISADEIHPSLYGMQQIADQLYEKIKHLVL